MTATPQIPSREGFLHHLQQGLAGRSRYALAFVAGVAVFAGSLVLGLGYHMVRDRIVPGIALNHLEAADRELARGDFSAAAAEYGTAAAVAPDDDQALMKLAYAARQGGDREVAIDALRRVLAVDSSHAGAHHQLALLHLEEGELDAAVRHSYLAARLLPGRVEPLEALGSALVQQGRVDKGVEVYRRILELDPGRAYARQTLADLERMVTRRVGVAQ